jgi:hypothetical protein
LRLHLLRRNRMGPAMMPVPVLMVIANCAIVISVPALLCHALLRKYWLACFVTWLLAFASGFAVAHLWGFPFSHLAFGFFASLIGLATGMLVGLPFLLQRRSWFARLWTHLMDRDLPHDEQDLDLQVARLKEIARRRRQRVTASLAFWFIAGVVAALTTWFSQETHNRDSALLSGALGFGLAIFFGGSIFTRLLFRKRNAAP